MTFLSFKSSEEDLKRHFKLIFQVLKKIFDASPNKKEICDNYVNKIIKNLKDEIAKYYKDDNWDSLSSSLTKKEVVNKINSIIAAFNNIFTDSSDQRMCKIDLLLTLPLNTLPPDNGARSPINSDESSTGTPVILGRTGTPSAPVLPSMTGGPGTGGLFAPPVPYESLSPEQKQLYNQKFSGFMVTLGLRGTSGQNAASLLAADVPYNHSRNCYMYPNSDMCIPNEMINSLSTQIQNSLSDAKLHFSKIMPGELTKETKKDMEEQINTIYNNRDFDDKINNIKTKIKEFIQSTCLQDKDIQPQSFEHQLINIDVFLNSLGDFETALRKGKKYKAAKKDQIEGLKKKEVGKVQDLKEIPEPSIKSTSILSKLNRSENYKLFKEIAFKDQKKYNTLVSSNNIINGNVVNQTFAPGFPNTHTRSGTYTTDFNNPLTPTLKSINTNHNLGRNQSLDKWLEMISEKSKMDFQAAIKDTKNNGYDLFSRTENNPLKTILEYSINNSGNDKKALIFINIVSNDNVKVNCDALPFLKLLKGQGLTPPGLTKKYTQFMNKLHEGKLFDMTEERNPTYINAFNDFESNYATIYGPFLSPLFSGTQGIYNANFSQDGILNLSV